MFATCGGWALAFAKPASISNFMKRLKNICGAVIALIAASTAAAQDANALEAWQADHTQIVDAADIALADLQWLARPVVVFAESPNDPSFIQQMELLTDRIGELAERDVIVITDTDPDADTEWRTELRPRGFMLALVGKDGQVKLRKPSPWDVRELSRSIDKMPMRQQEIEDRREG